MPQAINHGNAQGLRTAAVGSSFVSIGIGAVYWISRIGFSNPVTPVIAAIGLGLLFINVPLLAWSLVNRRGQRGWVTSYPFLWLVSFAVIALAGRMSVGVAGEPAMPIAFLGAIAFLAVLIAWARAASFRFAFLFIAGSAVFSTWAAGVVWGRIYKSPLFFEMMTASGIVHHDAVTLGALGNMLRTYHVASMGLDGLTYMAYHWGTAWLFAQLSNLTGETVLRFYQLGFPVTMIPLFFGAVVAFAAQMSREGDSTRDWRFWVVFLAASVGIFPITGMDALGVWTSNLMISESYTVGIPVALMLLALVMTFWRERGGEVLGNAATTGDYAFLVVVLPAVLVALGYIKISMMILGFGAVIYAGLRTGAWRRWPLALIGLGLTILIYWAFRQTSLVAHHEGVVLLDYMKAFVPRVWWPFFFLAHLFWSTLYLVLRLWREKARTLGDVVSLARAGRILDVEVVAVVAAAGVIPGLVLHIDGGSAFYFSDVQRWIALSLILASLTLLLPRIDRVRWNRLSTIAILFVALPLAVSTLRNSFYWTRRMARANAELRRALYPAGEAAGIPPAIRSLPRLMDPAKLDAGLRRSVNYNPVSFLMELDRLPLAEKRRSAVFVPQSELRYWTILKRPNACGFGGHVVPSLTGIAMIDGMPPFGCPLSPYYGLSLFEKRTRPQTAADTSPSALCARAVAAGFERVIVLHFDDDGRMTRAGLDCRGSA